MPLSGADNTVDGFGEEFFFFFFFEIRADSWALGCIRKHRKLLDSRYEQGKKHMCIRNHRVNNK